MHDHNSPMDLSYSNLIHATPFFVPKQIENPWGFLLNSLLNYWTQIFFSLFFLGLFCQHIKTWDNFKENISNHTNIHMLIYMTV